MPSAGGAGSRSVAAEDLKAKGPEAGGPAAPDCCGACRRDGTRCPRPPMPEKRRCRQHGGAPGVGAPKGGQNARKHGLYTCAAKAERRQFNEFIRSCLRTLREIEGR